MRYTVSHHVVPYLPDLKYVRWQKSYSRSTWSQFNVKWTNYPASINRIRKYFSARMRIPETRYTLYYTYFDPTHSNYYMLEMKHHNVGLQAWIVPGGTRMFCRFPSCTSSPESMFEHKSAVIAHVSNTTTCCSPGNRCFTWYFTSLYIHYVMCWERSRQKLEVRNHREKWSYMTMHLQPDCASIELVVFPSPCTCSACWTSRDLDSPLKLEICDTPYVAVLDEWSFEKGGKVGASFGKANCPFRRTDIWPSPGTSLSPTHPGVSLPMGAWSFAEVQTPVPTAAALAHEFLVSRKFPSLTPGAWNLHVVELGAFSAVSSAASTVCNANACPSAMSISVEWGGATPWCISPARWIRGEGGNELF